ncbi:MAG: hypothetical protein MUO77_07255 [Anaerolineales bacterium]|nr:hypothetical protein [Anaerolineales bacterium]
MKPSKQKGKIIELLFGLSDESTNSRDFWRKVITFVICMTLSGISVGLTIFGGVEDRTSRLIVIVMSLIKYFPILWVVNNFAQKKAANYLSDIFELNDNEAALNFIESVAFGHSSGSIGMKNMGYDAQSGRNIQSLAVIYGEGKITVKDGKISESDEQSPVILIGGPGLVKVGLDHLVVFEDVHGRPNIFHPRDKPWKIGKYERIREIGDHQYAIINLRDQFIRGISIKSRTKDGIPIEARDIKIIFSILRKQQKNDASKDAALLYDPEAVKALVYSQTMITSDASQTFGAAFPWDSVVIPLIVSEIENIITTRPLNEILASIGQKELEAQAKTDQSIETIKIEITGQQRPVSRMPEKTGKIPDFASRSIITARFYESEFVKKAARAGIHVQWIDIGTWKLPSDKIMEKHKDAWNKSRENVARRMMLEKIRSKNAQMEFARLVDDTIIKKYEKAMGTIGATGTIGTHQLEEEEKEAEMEYYREVYATRSRSRQEEAENHPETLALEILKAFRKELSVANKEVISNKSKKMAESIENAQQHISALTAHYVGSKQ